MCPIAVIVDRILRNTFTGTLYFLEIVLWHDAYVFSNIIRWHPAAIGYPACIRTSYFCPWLVLETRLLSETRLLLEVLRYVNDLYPVTVLQSGSRMSWASEVTISVVSVPDEPCTRTIADSLSTHWAATHAHVSASLMWDNQPHESSRDNHLSLDVFTS